MKMLFYGESPCLETGAARVSRYLLDAIVQSGIEVDVLATSHLFGNDYDKRRYPFPIASITGDNDMKTHEEAGNIIAKRLHDYDVLCINGDMHVPQILKPFLLKKPSIVLGAIDGPVLYAEQIDSFSQATFPVVYSRYAYEQCVKACPSLEGKLRCIPLGCEPEVFYPLDEQQRKDYRKSFQVLNEDTFLVQWSNRNQIRKDPARALAAFKLFHSRVPNSALYMLTKVLDVGGDITIMAKFLQFPYGKLLVPPPATETVVDGNTVINGYTEIAGFPRETQNRIYNAADVAFSTSQGEGWGLTTTDYMAAGIPFIGPANTTFFELLGHKEECIPCFAEGERGYLVESGGNDLWQVYYGRDHSIRPITSVQSMASALHHVYLHREQAQEKAKRARLWTYEHTWQHFIDAWKTALSEALHAS